MYALPFPYNFLSLTTRISRRRMTSILLSRLMLDLRQSNSADSAGGTYISHALTTMMFDGSSGPGAGGPARSGADSLTDSNLFREDDDFDSEGGDDADIVDVAVP